jgi:cell division protein FtsQ
MATGATRKLKVQAVAHRGGRLWHSLLSVFVACGLLSLTGVGAWQLLSLPVNRVAVTGDLKQVKRDELMAVISDSISGGFLWLDLQAVRAPVEALPWVHRAVVRRQWPDSIEVQVIEQRVIAAWGDSAYLNHAGEVFRPASAVTVDGLPLLSGPAGSQGRVMTKYQQVQERLQTLGLRVSALQLDARGGLRATLSGGAELVFGRDDLDGKLDRLEAIYRAQSLSRRAQLARVDLRYSHGAAVAWRNDKKQES